MEDQRAEERKMFLKRKRPYISYKTPFLAHYADPMKKREEFAVTLRKKKTFEVINAKRRKIIGLMMGGAAMTSEVA
jgi:hypothetical protein